METKVVNLRNEPYDVYIGRAGHGQDGFFGNLHPLGKCPLCETIHKRSEAIAAFKKDFLVRIDSDMTFRQRVMALKGKRLGCFCKPVRCHGDVIKEWLDTQPSP